MNPESHLRRVPSPEEPHRRPRPPASPARSHPRHTHLPGNPPPSSATRIPGGVPPTPRGTPGPFSAIRIPGARPPSSSVLRQAQDPPHVAAPTRVLGSRRRNRAAARIAMTCPSSAPARDRVRSAAEDTAGAIRPTQPRRGSGALPGNATCSTQGRRQRHPDGRNKTVRFPRVIVLPGCQDGGHDRTVDRASWTGDSGR